MFRLSKKFPILLVACCALLLPSCSLIGTVIGLGMSVGKIKLAFGCLPEGTLIDTPQGDRFIETLQPGDVVMGFDGEPVQVQQKHAYLVGVDALPFLHLQFDDGSELSLSGQHRITGIPANDLKVGDRVAGRGISAIATREGVTRSYDLLTGDAGYRIDGIPVNSMIEEMATATRNSPSLSSLR